MNTDVKCRVLRLFNSSRRHGRHLKAAHGLKRAVTMTAMFLAALSAAVTVSNSLVCYAVSLDGENICTVKSRADVASAVKDAQKNASDLLGEEISISDGVTVTAKFRSSKPDNTETLADKLLGTVSGIEKKYAVTVNGVAVCAAENRQMLDRVLGSILASYTNENTVAVDFVQDVSVEFMYVNEDLIMSESEIADMLSPETDSAGLGIIVASVETSETYDTVAPGTEYLPDCTRYEDDEVIVQSGSVGVTKNSRTLYKYNGNTVKSVCNNSEVIVPVTNNVVSVGALAGSRTDSTGTYIWPAEGTLSSYFGRRNAGIGSTNHKGIDIANETGTEIVAADGGEVILVSWQSGYGRLVEIKHDNGDITYYAHLKGYKVSEGDRVAQGDVIGYMGSTGVSSGTHLHFEIHPDGEKAVDPLTLLPEE